jgi:hypothetical protein
VGHPFQPEGKMIQRFQNDEDAYLRWVQANPDGYVVNVDEPRSFPQYPMVHRASHKVMSTPARTNYTTGDFIKICSMDLNALEQWSQEKYGRSLTRCAGCM